MDQFIATITRTTIFANLTREDLARVAGKVDQVPVVAGRHPYQAAHFGTGGQGFSHAQGRRFMLAKLVVSVLAIAASLPWWRAIGLIR